MDGGLDRGDAIPDGIRVGRCAPSDLEPLRVALLRRVAARCGTDAVQIFEARGGGGEAKVACRLSNSARELLAPGLATTGLAGNLDLRDDRADDLRDEIVAALLLAPRAIEFPSFAELASHIRIRANIVRAAQRTALSFDAYAAERPEAFWTYCPGRGFVVRPGMSLIEALRAATQPDGTGRLFSFSCYRATEYVILYALAQELERCNRPLLDALQRRWEIEAIQSRQFHEVFLREYGSADEPIPPGYYVPGDRVWFRNPDARSSDVVGFEGSWVFYLGHGRFSNFWRQNRPFTLESKCLEIFHWRHGVVDERSPEPRMDEVHVDRLVAQALAQPEVAGAIVARMMRLADRRGCYGDGGCIDRTREFPRWICPGTADLEFSA
jgi:hypothetical protein